MRKSLLVVCTMLCSLFDGQAVAQTTMKAELKSGEQKNQWVLEVSLENEQPYVAMQMDVDLPDSISETKVQKSERMQAQTMLSKRMKNGRLRILAYNMTSKPILGNNGRLLSVLVTAPEWPEGTYMIQNIHLTSPGSKDNALPDIEIQR